jgi:hypothetical protein
MWCWWRMEEMSGPDRLYMKKCYIQWDVTPRVFYLPKILVLFSLQRSTWRLYNYLNIMFKGLFIVNQCPIIVQQVANIYGFIIFSADRSTCFGWYPHPSSGAHSHCNYNILHWSNRICYRPLTRRCRNIWHWLNDYGSTSFRCCNYSVSVLLIMDEDIIRNM